MSFTDEWATSTVDQTPTPSASESPLKRASRHNRISNEIEHSSFTRTRTDTGESERTDYKIGDAVLVDDTVKLKQKFLHPPLYQLPPPTTSKGGKGKRKKAELVLAEEYEGWRHEDGLSSGDKVAVITRLFEDVRGTKMALVRWLARPGAVWGPEGPQDDEVGCKLLPYELYYTADSSHLLEQRQIEYAQAERQSPSKRKSSNASPSKSSFISSVASLKTPLHSDPVPLSSIIRQVQIVSAPVKSNKAGEGERQEIVTKEMQEIRPTFLVRKVYDVKPIPGASFWSDLPPSSSSFQSASSSSSSKESTLLGGFDYLKKKGIKQWEKSKDSTGKTKGWDVEPEMEADSEDEVILVRRKKVEKKKKERKERKEKSGESAPRIEFKQDKEESDSETDGGEDDGEVFRPDKRVDASSDEEDDEGDSTSSSSSDDDDEDSEGNSSDEDEQYHRRSRKSPTKRSTSTRSKSVTVSPTKKRSQTATISRPTKRRKLSRPKDPSTHNPLPPLLSSTYLDSLPTPLERAKALLHVSATPGSLPCREEQRSQIRQFVEDAVLSRSGGCLYVHGVPGTGKTATVHSVVRELQEDPDMDSFTFVEINGMKISEPNAAFSHLWNALNVPSTHSTVTTTKNSKISPKAALSALEGWFANPDPARKTTVVLVDELDQMLTKRQEVLYNFFNWPHSAHSRLVVIAVANTMDLPERELNGKIRSRLGTNRIAFQPYNWTELKKILEARLSLVTSGGKDSTTVRLFEDTALQKIAKSVAGISGDARKALDVARRTLDRVALRNQSEGGGTEGIVKCTIQDATAAYNEMTKTGPGFFVKRLSFHEKVLLLALAQCIRRAGVPEVELDSVLSWHDTFLRQTHLLPSSSAYPSKSDLMTLVSQLHAMRLLATESQRLDVFQKVRAGVEEGDVFAALREDDLLKNHVPQA
ncbi:hypothetical protein JCM3765_003115 [Sporobolomyces pararoseus]